MAKEKKDMLAGPGAFQMMILRALSAKPMGEVYGGTANPNKVAKRRAKNKVAKQSRKRNRE